MAGFHRMILDHGDVQALIDALESLKENVGPLNPREARLHEALQDAASSGDAPMMTYDARERKEW